MVLRSIWNNGVFKKELEFTPLGMQKEFKAYLQKNGKGNYKFDESKRSFIIRSTGDNFRGAGK